MGFSFLDEGALEATRGRHKLCGKMREARAPD
jgi:hypothetical protein